MKLLYAYWNRVRNGRLAPRRLDIEPAAIAPLLPETFIAECAGPMRYRFRLVGTKICHQFCRELGGTDFLDLWEQEDREEVTSLLVRIFGEGAVGEATFLAHTKSGRSCRFDLLLMPLTHGGDAVNRCLGAIAAADAPFWLGAEPDLTLELIDTALHWPKGEPAQAPRPQEAPHPSQLEALIRSRFTVHDGGLSSRD
ncbi:PAS domain-containing protein [Methyloligella sp. GL2]|uniref:PAS domain-containing protein n=1 Tax=Methyloligella sp. GL2 TaxID=2742204 RepID=UPI00157BBA3E|nr:PAS domain-containing protein [Methyloligella sp. GL2]QKP77304.1 PAS domain-containing protein [Methyloligella sp. GL2]